jgi:hypothetical protein
MADKKINMLPLLEQNELDPGADSVLVYDVSDGKAKRLLIENLGDVSVLPIRSDSSRGDWVLLGGLEASPSNVTKIEISTVFYLDLFFADQHELSTNDQIFIHYDNRIKGFNLDAYGLFQIEKLTDYAFRIPAPSGLSTGTFTTSGVVELLPRKSYNFYYNGDKTVEVIYQNGKKIAHSTINGAILDAAANSGVVIVHKKSTPYTENIILKNGVDLVLDNVEFTANNSPLFSDAGVSTTCNITGSVLTHTGNFDVNTFQLTNTSSDVNINFNKILVNSTLNTITSKAVIESSASNLGVNVGVILNKRGGGVYLNNTSGKYDIRIGKLETGVVGSNQSGSTGVITKGNGFLDIHEIIINNVGSCLSQRSGKCVAHVNKMYSKTNFGSVTDAVAVLGSNADDTSDLVLVFDEISTNSGSVSPGTCIRIERGKFNITGNKTQTDFNATGAASVSINAGVGYTTYPEGRISVKEMISLSTMALHIDIRNNTKVIVVENSNLISNITSGSNNYGALNIGPLSDPGAVAGSTVEIRNSTIKQTAVSASRHAVSIRWVGNSVLMSNCEISIPDGGGDSIYSTGPTDIFFRNSIWLSKEANSNLHFINSGTLIE